MINKHFCTKEGMFYYAPFQTSNNDIEDRLEMQGDGRVFNTLQGVVCSPVFRVELVKKRGRPPKNSK
jgi:hypothetical protein